MALTLAAVLMSCDDAGARRAMVRRAVAILCGVAVAAAVAMPAQAQAGGEPSAPIWPVAGRLGQLQFIVVPAEALAAGEAEYRRQAGVLCEQEATCFLRFFSNSTGAALSMPLPDAVLAEPLARLSRSGKRGMEVFEWSCRVLAQPGRCY